ncbi:TIGR02285 family protein [Paucibacter sp. KCTC 42545]|uniref:TIGR02285 family protein n=1 Tax=Paucibacter sp. KCTC 42545 TaxID=1768242 RepID=UPI0012E3EC8C|nr:TIGR02285 family protein [Paucibacter sp. KCTC 42545]
MLSFLMRAKLGAAQATLAALAAMALSAGGAAAGPLVAAANASPAASPGASFAPTVVAAAEPAFTMQWLVQDYPPHFSYINGRAPRSIDDLGRGEIDGFLRLMVERMPQFRHGFVDAGMPRFETLVRQGQTICSVLHVRTPERLSWLYFTHLYPPQFSRQIHVIVRRDKLAQFTPDAAQPLSLSDILQRKDLVGLLPRGRSFGPKIDALLQAQGEQAPKTLPSGRGNHLLAMLRAQRMDYTLEYPSIVDEFDKSAEGSAAGPELVKLPIAEGRSTAVATAACSRTPEGRKAIAAIDQVVRKLAQDPQREAWIRAWRGPQADEQDLVNIRRYMDERARSGPQIE